MTMISASALFAGNKARGKMGSDAIQIARTPFWSKKSVCIRKAPYTIENPTPGQIWQRIKFGTLARLARGHGFDYAKGLPGVAAYIQVHASELRGNPYSRPAGTRTSTSFHTLEQLQAMQNKATGTGYQAVPPLF